MFKSAIYQVFYVDLLYHIHITLSDVAAPCIKESLLEGKPGHMVKMYIFGLEPEKLTAMTHNIRDV